MKYLFYALLWICLPIASMAQGTYKLTGTALDGAGKPVSFATISLWTTGQTSPYAATTANDNGEYVLDKIVQGTYTLKAELVGYITAETTLVFDAKTLPTMVQNLTVQEDSKQLKEVVVEGKKEFIEVTPDATIVRPDANPTTQGGTATDVLQQVPSVQIDANGNISMRGGRPNIMVNGRSSGFGDMRRGGGGGGMGGNPLDQINSEDIESISISNNPSARFDAEGGGGMIDIRLKRDRNLGTHGTLAGGVGVPRGRVNGNFRINHRAKKWNVFTGYGMRIDNRLGTGKMERTTFDGAQNITQLLNQSQVTANSGNNHNVRSGADYYFSDKTTLGIEGTYGYRYGNNDDNTKTNFLDANNALLSLTQQLNYSTSTSKTLDYSAIFRHEFKKPKQELTATFSQVYSKDDSNNDLNLSYFKSDMSPLQAGTQRRTNNANNNVNTNFQIDFATPHGKKGTFETGVKINMRDLTTNSLVENFLLNEWQKDFKISNTFAFTENVQAGYLAYRNSLGKWDYSTGLRIENVIMKGNVVAVENTNFRKDFTNLFPTARISYNINADQFVKLAFTRRISRPNFGDLNPFVDISNPLSYRTGNPNINPEFNYNFELGYSRTWDKFMFSPSVFYRMRTNIVQRITTLDTDTNISFSRPDNVGKGNTYGIELTGSAKLTTWWDLNMNYSFFQNDIIATDIRGINSSVNSWTARVNNNFSFWNNTRLTMNLFYNSPTAIAQGTIMEMFGMGLGLQKPLWDRKGSIGINIRDMFYSMRFGSETRGSNFVQSSSIQRDSRVVMMNLRYRF